MKKATIYDYARMCKSFNGCGMCPLFEFCGDKIEYSDLDKINKIILKWCKKHPAETRQDRFLKMFPKANICYDCIAISPCDVDIRQIDGKKCGTKSCVKCRKEYWLAEVDENE